jgi:hypothetical protein
MVLNRGEELCQLLPGERINLLLRIVALVHKAPHVRGRIARQQAFFHGMIQHLPQGNENVLDTQRSERLTLGHQ